MLFFTSRDDATTGSPASVAPGSPAAAVRSAALGRGNVVLRAAPASLPAARRLAEDMAGPADAALREAGQAVVVAPSTSSGVTAQAWQRELRVASADDPRLRAFVEYWLGRGAG